MARGDCGMRSQQRHAWCARRGYHKSLKAQHKARKLVYQGRHGAQTTYKDQVSEAARPLALDDRSPIDQTTSFTELPTNRQTNQPI